MHPLVNIAVSAARSAGNVILKHSERVETLQVDRKQHNDFVTQVDRSAEAEIIRTIHKAYPDHAILGEESGASGDSEVRWIIDPLDGTTNFLHRIPHYAVSIGIEVRGRLEHGVIYAPALMTCIPPRAARAPCSTVAACAAASPRTSTTP